MSGVRVLVGTHKGAFILTSDGKRKILGGLRTAFWRPGDLPREGVARRSESDLSPPRSATGSARSSTGRRTAARPGTRSATSSSTKAPPGPTPGTTALPHPWEFKRIWHFEPSLTDPDTIYAGAEDAALFRSIDGGQTWSEVASLRTHESGVRSGPRAPVGWASTPFCSIPRTRSACTSPSPPPASSAPTTAGRPGSRPTTGCAPISCPIRRPRSGTASIALRCIPPAQPRSSCRSTGT